jgi:hypothetical protein
MCPSWPGNEPSRNKTNDMSMTELTEIAKVEAALVDKAERIMARPNGTRGFNSLVAGEIIHEFLNGRRDFADTYEFQGLPDDKAADWHALAKQAALYLHRGWVRFHAADGTLLPVNVIP